MNDEEKLQPYLRIWKNIYTEKMKTDPYDIPHILEEDIYKMVEDGGMVKADPEAIEHLSLCPVCMDNWVGWREAISVLEQGGGEEQSIMSYGIVEAAATHDIKEAINYHSACGRFTLTLSPPLDSEEEWLVTLRAVDDHISFEGMYIEIRDRNGVLLLEGRLVNGRLARYRGDLSNVDLSNWTIIEKKEETE